MEENKIIDICYCCKQIKKVRFIPITLIDEIIMSTNKQGFFYIRKICESCNHLPQEDKE